MTPAAKCKFSGQLIKAVERPKGSIAHRVGMLTAVCRISCFPTSIVILSMFFSPTAAKSTRLAFSIVAVPCTRTTGRLRWPRLSPVGSLIRLMWMSLTRSLQMPRAAARILRATASSWPTIPGIPRGHAHGPRKSATFMRGFVKLGFRTPRERSELKKFSVTYHEACHLCHGQKITKQPREVLNAIPGLELIELTESTWCCGSAGIYNITQPEMAAKLQERKLVTLRIPVPPSLPRQTLGASCSSKADAASFRHVSRFHPISLLAEAYRSEDKETVEVRREDRLGSKQIWKGVGVL